MFAKQSDFAAVTVEFKSKDLSDAIEPNHAGIITPNARESAIYAVHAANHGRRERTATTLEKYPLNGGINHV